MRATARSPRRTARSVLVVVACTLAAWCVVAAPAAAGAGAAGGVSAETSAETLRASTDAQLALLVEQLEAEAERTGEQLLADDARRDDVRREREAARELLAVFLAEAYKQGSVGDSLVSQLLASRSLGEATDRVRIASVVGRHHGSLIRTLDSAESRIDVGTIERAQSIARLTDVQAQLVRIRDEQARRAVIRAGHEAARAAREQAAAQAQARTLASQAATAMVPGALIASSTVAPSTGSPSAASIDAYLAGKGSPMTGQGAAFMASGQRWRVDPRLLVAIAGAESSFGQVTCGPHNAWGWACPNDPADFATWAAGIDTVTSGLRNYYLDEGRTSVRLIQQKYCPVGAANDPTGLNSHWNDNVTKFLLEQGGNPSMVGPGPAAGEIQLPDLGGLGLLAVD